MKTRLHCLRVAIFAGSLSVLGGCTLYAPGTPTLQNTTSAEQTQRIFWQEVKAGKWQSVQSLLTANVTWRNGSSLLTRDAVVPYLQQLQIREVLITDLTVRANNNDMTVTYQLQLTTATSPQPLNLQAVAVWQQPPPLPPDASKKVRKVAAVSAPYLLTVEDLEPASGPDMAAIRPN